MAKLVPLKDQMKEVVKTAPVSKAKTGPVLPGSSVSKPKKTAEPTVKKMDVCRAIYNKMLDKPRKEVVLKFISDAEMTVAGAQNYYQRFKKESEE